jgi:ribosomal protein S18
LGKSGGRQTSGKNRADFSPVAQLSRAISSAGKIVPMLIRSLYAQGIRRSI